MAEGDQLIVALVVGKIEACDPSDGLQGRVARPLHLFGQRLKLAAGRDSVEAAHTHIDRMDLAPAEQGQDLVAGLLQRQPAPHRIAVVARHVDGALVAEEVGRMQHVDMQGVALDPFAAVEQPAKVAQGACDLNAQGLLHRVNRTHLVRHRADAADPRGDVRRLGVGAPAQKRLEEPGRLEDAQLGALDHAVAHHHLEGALALYPGKIVDLDGLTDHCARSPCGTPASPR